MLPQNGINSCEGSYVLCDRWCKARRGHPAQNTCPNLFPRNFSSSSQSSQPYVIWDDDAAALVERIEFFLDEELEELEHKDPAARAPNDKMTDCEVTLTESWTAVIDNKKVGEEAAVGAGHCLCSGQLSSVSSSLPGHLCFEQPPSRLLPLQPFPAVAGKREMKTLWLLLILLLVYTVCSQEELSNPDCNHWLDPGDCNNFTVKWYYDRYDHRCRQFYYSGCSGNANTFNSLEECSASCTYVPPTAADRCSLPHEPGNCNSDIERWFFDWEKKQCVCSYWTGCGGNSNLFYSYNHCMEICGDYSHPGIGPGIDEKYWGVLNQSTMSPENQAVFVNKPAFVYRADAWWNPANGGGQHAPAHPQPNTLPNPVQPAYSYPTPASNPYFYATPDNPFPFTVQAVPYAPALPDNFDDNDYSNDYREMVASETKVDIPILARGAKTVTIRIPIRAKLTRVEKSLPEIVATPPKRWTKKIRKHKTPPRKIQGEEVTIPASVPSTSQSTFSYSYHTDSRGNMVAPPVPTRETPIVPTHRAKDYPSSHYQPFTNTRYSQYRTQNSPMLRTPIPTQFYVTYKTDQFGRQVWNQKIWWTGEGPMPIQALRSRYPYWLPPPYDGFGRNPYEDYERVQDARRWNQAPAIPVTTAAPPITPHLAPTTTSTTTTTTTTPAPTFPPITQLPIHTTQIYYTTPPPPVNVYNTQKPYHSTQHQVQTTVPTWVRRYPSTLAPVYPQPTRPWWTYTASTTTTPAPTRPPPPVQEHPTRPLPATQEAAHVRQDYAYPPKPDNQSRYYYEAPTRSSSPVQETYVRPLPPSQEYPAKQHYEAPSRPPAIQEIPTRPPQSAAEAPLRQYVRQPPTYMPAVDMTNHYQRPLIQDMTPHRPYTTPRTFNAVRKATAEPVEYQRWLVQRITTEKPELSIDDIIALDEEAYDDYDMQMEPDPQDEPQGPPRQGPHQPQRQPPPPSPAQTRRPPPQQSQVPRNDGWAPIVMPPPSKVSRSPSVDYANSVDFEIQSHHGDA